MTETLTEVTRIVDCPECHQALVEEVCVNPDCKEAQAVASVAAGRTTAKATAETGVTEVAPVTVQERPRSFASSGRPD